MVKKILKKSVESSSTLLFSKQRTILSGALVIAIMLLASALLGLIKKRLYASIITPGPELDVFFAAFRLPDLAFQLFIGGSINAAFIPVFSEVINKKSKNDVWKFVSSILNLTLVLFTGLGLIFWIFAPQMANLIGPGFDAEQKELLITLMRILLLAPILLGVSSFVAGTLQSFKRFFLPFLSPVVYNLGAIFGILVLFPLYGIVGAAWGVVIGAVAHLLIQLPLLVHIGFKYQALLEYKSRNIRKMFILAIPRTVGAGIEQVRSLVLVILASFLPAGSISIFDLGQSIITMPVSILGVSIATASLPQFAALYARNEIETLKKAFKSSFNQILFFIAPVVVILVVLKIPVVRLVYGSGNFSWTDTTLTAWVVAYLGIGIFAHALNGLMIRLCYAMQDTVIPLIMGIVSVVVTISIAIAAIILDMEHGLHWMAISVSVGAVVEFILLFIVLTKRKYIDLGLFVGTPIKIVISALLMAIAVYVPVKFLDETFLDTTRVVNLLILVWLVVSLGGTTYLLSTWILGVRELALVFKILVKIKGFRESVEKSITSPQIVTNAVIEESNPND